MNDKNIEKLKKMAKELALKNNCVNDSNFSVSAILVTCEGKIYKGHNIENSGIQSTCGERVAFSKAISMGENRFSCLFGLGYSFNDKKFVSAWPCGYCRDFMSKFVGKDFKIYTIDENENILEKTIFELAPFKKFQNISSEIKTESLIEIQKTKFENKIKNFGDIKNEMIGIAQKASENTVNMMLKSGASLLCENEKGEAVVFSGCSQTDGECTILDAEKVALLKALSEGVKNFKSLVVIEDGKIICPRYNSLQLYLQYTNKNFEFILNDGVYKIAEMLPEAFEF